MADNVYLLETRLSVPQQTALNTVRDVARQQGLTVFLVGGAVRDLISGSPVRDLDVAVQGNALKLRKELELAGAEFSGQSTPQQALYLRFPGGVRVEVESTLSATYPKPGRPVYTPTSILEDLRRRDFTANAMALSLNEGSYGLLMDPLNGVADIENRELRLVSNYGFIEDPIRMVRATRFMARLGWRMDERTQGRYETGKQENYIAALQPAERGYELEELFHEEEPLRVLRRLEDEGWLQQLAPALSAAKANVNELAKLREVQLQLQTRGISADAAAGNFPLLTAKLSAKEIAELKASFPRAGFVREIESLEAKAKEFGAKMLSKELARPSQAFQYMMQAHPAVVLWSAYSTRSAALQNRFKAFQEDWPQAQAKVPYLLMAEMRITPDLPGYGSLVQEIIYELMDDRLPTPEAMRSFLEPHSPPAPPPPISLRRPRAPRKEAKVPKSRKKPQEAEAPADPETAGTPIESATAAAAPEAAVPRAPERRAQAGKVAPAKTQEPAAAPTKTSVKAPPAQKPAATAPATKTAVKKAAPAEQKRAVAASPAKKAAKKATANKAVVRSKPEAKAKPAPKSNEARRPAAPQRAGKAKAVQSKTVAKAKPKPAAKAAAPKKAVPAKKAPAKGKKAVPAKKAGRR